MTALVMKPPQYNNCCPPVQETPVTPYTFNIMHNLDHLTIETIDFRDCVPNNNEHSGVRAFMHVHAVEP